MDDDEQFQVWTRWLDIIERDIVDMLDSRRMYQEVIAIARANPRINTSNLFYSWLWRVYARDAVVSVRRQNDPGRCNISMRRLLEEIHDHPQVLSRERYVKRFPPMLQCTATKQFDRIAGLGADHIDPSVPAGDLDRLIGCCEKVKRFANKRIAHWDKAKSAPVATLADLDACIDLLDKLAVKYINLLRAEDMVRDTLLPVILSPWKRIFKEPWIPPSGRAEC